VKLAKVVFSHKNYQLAYNELNRYVQKFQNLNDPELIGFKECDIFKIANRYRYELLLRSKNNRSLINLLHTIDTPLASIDMDCLV
jgi:primosomal protein N' (replication factor Y)